MLYSDENLPEYPETIANVNNKNAYFTTFIDGNYNA